MILNSEQDLFSINSPRSNNCTTKDSANISFTGQLFSSAEYDTPITGQMTEQVLKNGEIHLELTLNTKITENGKAKIKSFGGIKVVLNEDDIPLETIVSCFESGAISTTSYNKTEGQFGWDLWDNCLAL